MFNRSLIAILLAVVISSAVDAQEKTVPTKTELIGQFASLTKSNRININVQLSLDDVKKNMSSLIEDDKDLSESQKQELKLAAKDIFAKLSRQTEDHLSNNQVLSKLGEQVIIDVYDKAFTETELKDLIDFFKTPLGQKAADFLATSSTRIQNEFKVRMESKIQEISRPLIDLSMDELRQRLTDIKKR